jgi:hypothetical protein
VLPLITPPPPVCLRLRLITSPPLTVPLLRLLSGWLSHRLLSHRRLQSTCASASHCTAASHRAPLKPLVWLVVTSLLITLPPPVRLRLRLSLHPSRASCPAGCCITSGYATTASSCLRLCLSLCYRLSLRPSHASFLAGCCPTSYHSATSRQPALHLSLRPSCVCGVSCCLRLCLSLCHHLSLRPSCASFPAGCCITSRHAALSCLPALRLSSHHCLSLRPSCASCLAGCCFASCHTTTSHQPAPLPLRALLSTGGVATGGGGCD